MVKVVGVALGAALMLSVGPSPAEAHKVIVFDDVYDSPGPPPPEQAEMIPPSPGEKVVWKPGHWKWKDGGWAWEPGRYEEKPVPQAVWVPGHWASHSGGSSWVPGYGAGGPARAVAVLGSPRAGSLTVRELPQSSARLPPRVEAGGPPE